MFCKNCGAEIDPNAAICVKCGFQKGKGTKYCQNCGAEVTEGAAACMNCGFALQTAVSGQKSKLVAGLLGIFLGGLGVHNFYLGYTGKAIAQILLSCIGIGAIWGLIEGILILVGKIDKDANGNLLGD
ncbi:MAG: TM2 domain-containing protein [Clostridiales bacterium]|nr:TM2 domain-containing protein [Candidatus Coliplasma caballi]